ncbi:hypothetical protein MKX31_16115 [Bacillus sp. FSL M8-0063]|uniref:hypothetical protein n=1 Tax=Bacillus sp. FSL M8-0063 TaxID=2921566 RepID=UPI0030F514A1
MIINFRMKKIIVITMICTLLVTLSSFSIFTENVSAAQPGHTFVRVETQVLATDPNNHDNASALFVGLMGIVPGVAQVKNLAQLFAYLGVYMGARTWLDGLTAAPNSFTVHKYIYKADEIKNNNYWGYYYITVTNGNTGETVQSKIIPIGKTA